MGRFPRSSSAHHAAPCSDNDGSNGIRAGLCSFRGLETLRVANDGTIYVLQTIQLAGQSVTRGSIAKVKEDGTVTEIFPGLGINVESFELDPNGDFIVDLSLPAPNPPSPSQYWAEKGIFRWRASLPTTSNGYSIPSSDGTQVYQFDGQGRHLSTLDSLTSVPQFTFAYDPNGYVNAVTDRDGRVTVVQRDSAGNPTAIVSPTGQQTTLAADGNGYLASITSPGGAQEQFQYTNGLMTNEVDARGGTHTFAYDPNGHLTLDQTPTGGGWTLSGSGEQVTMTSGEGRTSVYQSTNQSSSQSTPGGQLQGTRQLQVSDANGLTSSKQTDSQNDTQVTSADGTVTKTTLAADPRFGMAAPYVANQTITTPSGLGNVVSTSRTASIAADGLTVISQTDTTKINGLATLRTYDGATRTTTTTSPSGRQGVLTQDDHGRTVLSQVGMLAPSSYVYDSRGRLTSVTAGTGAGARATLFSYDNQDRATTSTDPLSLTTSFGYDSDNRVTSATKPDEAQTSSLYDPAGDLASLVPPGKTAHEFTYTLAGDEASYTAPPVDVGSSTTSYSYNLDRQLTLITRPDGKTVSFAFDSAGRPSTTTYDAGTVSRIYSTATGQLANVAATDGSTLDFGYDGDLLLSTTWSGTISGSVSRTWNNDFRMASESVNGGNTVAFSYDPDGLVIGAGAVTVARDPATGLITGTTLGSVADARTYNSFGERTGYLATYNATPIFQTQNTLDNLGRVLERTETIGGVSHSYDYTYDPAGRLLRVSTDGTVTAAYTYDGNGNRLSKTTPNGTELGSYDAQDRVLTYGKFSYTYTANGELVTKTDTSTGQITTYSYDAMDNLRGVTLPDGRVIEYLIDGMDRRIGKKINGQLVKGWLYGQGTKPVAELDGTGAITSRFVYAVNSNVPAYVIGSGVTYAMIVDDLGSVKEVVDVGSGTIAESIRLDEFGVVMNDSQPGFQPFGFGGGQYDPDTSLVRFGARDFDPFVGRWISKDPLRFAGGDGNLYAYVENDPINRIDATGLVISVSSPDLEAALASLAANPALAQAIEEIENSGVPVNVSDVAPFPNWLPDFGGAATGPTRNAAAVLIFIDLATVQQFFQNCGSPLTFDLKQTLAHELGHAFDLIFMSGQSTSSVDFENALRSSIKRDVENVECNKCPR